MFNNELHISNLLGTSYVAGNLAFAQNMLYSPIHNQIKKIDLANNETSILPFQNHHQIRIVAISPSAVVMVSIDVSGHSVIFNLKGNFIIAEFQFPSIVSLAKFSTDGKLFAIGYDHGFIVYESPSVYRTFQPLVLIKKYKNRHSSPICAMTFSGDSRFLVTGGQDNVMYINNLFQIQSYVAISLEVHRYKIVGIYYSHDMQFIYSIDSGANLFVWKWVTDHLSEQYQHLKASKIRKLANLQGKRISQNQKHEENQSMSQFEKQINDGRYIIDRKHILTQPGGYLKRSFFNEEMGFLTTAYSNGKFCIFKLAANELNLVQSFSVGENKISSLTVNESCTWIALGLKSFGQLIVWEWKSQSYILNQKGFIHQTTAIAFNSLKLYASATSEGKVKLWDSKSGFCLSTFQEHQASVTDLKFSNPTTLFSCSLDGSVHAYDAMKYKKFRTFRSDSSSQLQCLQVEQSGEIVFAGSFDPYEIYSWNVQTGNMLQIIGGHEGPISCIRMVGEQLISGSWDRTLKIHEVFARKLNVETLDHSSEITALAVHPNSKQIAAATIKGEIYLWETQTGNLSGIIQAEIQGGRSYFSKMSAQNDKSSKYIKTIAYSTCGNYLYGGGKSKFLMVYDIHHRMVLAKIPLTKNKDLQGVVQKLNSKFIKNGVSTFEMTVQGQEYDQSNDEEGEKLPGAKKLDISDIRTKLEVEVKTIVVKSARELLINTSFGILQLSTLQNNKSIFNPSELRPDLTPALIPTLVQNKEYASAILVVLKLNLNLKKLLQKIPIKFIKQTINETETSKLELFLERVCEGECVNYREAMWIEAILNKGVQKLPANLRAAMEHLEAQILVIDRSKGVMEMALETCGFE